MSETLKRYATRYLHTDENKRSRLFFRMLLMLERYNFDAERIERAARKYFQELSTPHPLYGQCEGAEALPYDLLWPRVLLHLRSIQDADTVVQKSVYATRSKKTSA